MQPTSDSPSIGSFRLTAILSSTTSSHCASVLLSFSTGHAQYAGNSIGNKVSLRSLVPRSISSPPIARLNHRSRGRDSLLRISKTVSCSFTFISHRYRNSPVKHVADLSISDTATDGDPFFFFLAAQPQSSTGAILYAPSLFFSPSPQNHDSDPAHPTHAVGDPALLVGCRQDTPTT